MAINLSIVHAVSTPSAGAAQTWLEAPGDGAIWINPIPLALGDAIMVIAWGDASVSFNDLLIRTQQVEAALSNPAAGIGQAWPDVVVFDATSRPPTNFLGDQTNRTKRIVPSVFSFTPGPISPDIRLKVYWSA